MSGTPSPAPRTINLTPTWRGILPLLVESAIRGETVEVRQIAMEELYRLADLADRMNAKGGDPAA